MRPQDHQTFAVLLDVAAERRRQDDLRDSGRFAHTLADDGLQPAQKLACITEEVGEVARCTLAIAGVVQEDLGAADLRKELVQVAALAVAWVEQLDREVRTCPPGIGPGMPAHTWGDQDICVVCGARRGTKASA